MKKIAILLFSLLSLSMAAQGQGPEGRTAATLVADVLAQMPAGNGEKFNELMADLAGTGKAGVVELAGMLRPAAQGGNARVEYALGGLSRWVTTPGKESLRAVTIGGLIEALGRLSDSDAKAFVIRQLGIVGVDDAVAILKPYLDDEALKGVTVEVLTAIGGGQTPSPRDAVAPEAGRVADLAAKMSSDPSKVTKLLLRALKDNDRHYRFAALENASPWATAGLYGALVKAMPKLKPTARVDVMGWLTHECDAADRREVIAPIVGAAAVGLLSSHDEETFRAAARLLVATDNPAAIAPLAALLGSSDGERVAAAARALSQLSGDVAPAVAPMAAIASDQGRITALELLAARRATGYAGAVFEQTANPSPEVRNAAFRALQNVVTAADLDRLYARLESADPQNVSDTQSALAVAVAASPKEGRYERTLERMKQARSGKEYLHYPVVASTGDKRALKLIIERYDGETGAARDAAFEALLGWQSTGGVAKLTAICRSEGDGPRFESALKRLTVIGGEGAIDGEKRAEILADALEAARTDAQKAQILRLLGTTNSWPAMMLASDYLTPATGNVVKQAAAEAVMNIALGNPTFTGTKVEELLGRVVEILDNPDADYQRGAIRKHLSEMPAQKPFVLSDEERAEGFDVLFDGTDMDLWTGNKTDYRLQSGTISLYPSRTFGGNLYTEKDYSNFVFRFEFQLTPGANNGVGIRAERGEDAAYHGMEIQILDHDDAAYRGIAPWQCHGSVYGVIPARRAVLRPEGEWNEEEILADGDHIRVTLNGEVIVDGNIREASKGGTIDGKPHPGLFNNRGAIGFLGHGSKLKFRNIRIRELR